MTVLLLQGCKAGGNNPYDNTLKVTASAYVMDASEDEVYGAWGDALSPGVKCIAVSDDLHKMGLTHGTKVKIKGFEGDYTVMDRMSSKWEQKIDIFMGKDRKKALNWGVREVEIYWNSQ